MIPSGSVAKGVRAQKVTIREERCRTDGGVVIVLVVIECLITDRSAAAAGIVRKERLIADGSATA